MVSGQRPDDSERVAGTRKRHDIYSRPEQFEASLAGIDTLLLVPGKDAPSERIQQHRNVIAAARAAGVSTLKDLPSRTLFGALNAHEDDQWREMQYRGPNAAPTVKGGPVEEPVRLWRSGPDSGARS